MEESDSARVKQCPVAPRPEMVEAARKFMSTPKVRQTPFEDQKRFLVGKGVTEAEIEEARKTLPPSEIGSTAVEYENGSPNMQAAYGQVRQRSNGSGVMQFANAIIVLGGISYASYRLLRSVVLPRFFNVPDPAMEEQRQLQQQIGELQNSMKFVIDSVLQTLQTVNQQQEQLNALLLMNSREGTGISELQRLQSDISIVKSLLLNQNQFAAIPPNIRRQSGSDVVPEWQRAKNTNLLSSALSNGYQTPPTDANIHTEDIMNDNEVEQTLNGASEGSSV